MPTTTVQKDALKELVTQGLAALKTGGERAAKDADEIERSATNPDLKAALAEDKTTAKTWAERVASAMSELGASGSNDNPIIDAVYEVSKLARIAASGDDATRDLGIISARQNGLHYWIAAFGTMGNYLGQMGQSDAADSMSLCVDEAREADETHTKIADQILGKTS